ncbi:MAG: hypothetical protein AAF221_03280 [Pseudomonadota bacterium]
MPRRRDEEFSIAPLPREKRSAKVQRYILALTFAVVIAAALVVLASVLGLAIAPLFERDTTMPTSQKNGPDDLVREGLAGTASQKEPAP